MNWFLPILYESPGISANPGVDRHLLNGFEKRIPLRDPFHASSLINFFDVLLSAEGMRICFEVNLEVVEKCKQWESFVLAAENGSLSAWRHHPEGALALVLLLSQISRHIYHEFPRRVLALEAQAYERAADAIALGIDRECPIQWQMFFYYPYLRQESLSAQTRLECLVEGLIQRIKEGSGHQRAIKLILAKVKRRANGLRRFGRFPELNEYLGRVSTPAESEYLDRVSQCSHERGNYVTLLICYLPKKGQPVDFVRHRLNRK